MTQLIWLGTGCGDTEDLYNTCFAIKNENGDFLVDTGGSIEIVKRLKKANISLKEIKHIFISHNHTDHILGLIWMFKKIYVLLQSENIETKINIYCNDVVYKSIIEVSKHVLSEKLTKKVFSIIDFHILNSEDKVEINGIEYTFFDINARGTKQFGFECIIQGKRLVFLGDETLNTNLCERVRNADYVMHEAFCLDSEENIFHAYEKNHSTVKSACEVMNSLNVKNLILYHTEESHGNERKKLYTQEAEQTFKGNIYVPDELDIIEIGE